MESRNSAGIRKSFEIDLTNARDGKKIDASGRYIRIADASDTAAQIQIAIGEDNIASQYETLKKNGRIIEGNGFNSFYIKNTGQSGKWVRVIVSDGELDYDVDNPSVGTIDSIGGIDTPVGLDAAALAAIGGIQATMQSTDYEMVAGVLRPTDFGSLHGVGTSAATLFSAAANTDGAIVFTGCAQGASANFVYLASHTAAPANSETDMVILCSGYNGPSTIHSPILLPAGMGLYGVGTAASSGTVSASWKLL